MRRRLVLIIGSIALLVGSLWGVGALQRASRLKRFRIAVKAAPVRTTHRPFMVPDVELEAESAPDGSLLISCDLAYEQLADYYDNPIPRVPPDGVRPGRASISFTDKDWDFVPEQFCQPARSGNCRALEREEDRRILEIWSMALEVLSKNVADAK